MQTPKLDIGVDTLDNPVKHLYEEFLRLRLNHTQAERLFFARTVMGSSVVRVFSSGTKDDIIPALANLDIEEMGRCQTEADFRHWFERSLALVARAVKKRNATNSRVQPGYMWGHSAKVLNLFIRDVVLHSRLFDDETVRRISPWLYCPIDNIIIKRAKKLGCQMPVKAIKEIGTRKLFYTIQNQLNEAALAADTPRVWFDDNWGDRQ